MYLLSRKGRKSCEVASLTKIMTGFLVIKLCIKLDINIKELIIKVSKNAESLGGTTAGLRAGDELNSFLFNNSFNKIF